MKLLVIVAGLLLVLPLAASLVFGALLATFFAGLALIGALLKLAPVLALGLLLYWLVVRQRRTSRPGE
jgi:hypothetical protein